MSSVRIRYETLEFGDVDIHIRALRDNNQFSDTDGTAEKLGICSASWPLFGIVWPSGQVLAHLMANYDIEGKRILEVGCGIGLSSLVLNQRNANITATDYHPEAGKFLLENVKLNRGRDIPFIRTGWADENDELGRFDVIIGSDLLYERDHVDLLSGFVHRHSEPHCEIIIVDPGRAQVGRFSRKMQELGYSYGQNRPENTDYLPLPFKGRILRYRR